MELRSQLTDTERKLALLTMEKRDYEKAEIHPEKERLDLRKILEKFDSERIRLDSSGGPLSGTERSVADSNLSILRIENMELRRKIDSLETEKTEIQQKHLKEVLDLNSDHRRERQADNDKIRRLTAQLETLRQEKERCQNRIHTLEQQIAQYRDQIREYRNRSSAVAADVRRVRMAMTESLHNVATHPRVSSSVVDKEIQKIREWLSPCHSESPSPAGPRGRTPDSPHLD